jgi:hypothetical protein
MIPDNIQWPHDKAKAAIEEAHEVLEKNLAGIVVARFEVWEDQMMWVYGPYRWKRLWDEAADTRYPDDPMKVVQDVPLQEFLDYLKSWYWPKKQSIMAPDPRWVRETA